MWRLIHLRKISTSCWKNSVALRRIQPFSSSANNPAGTTGKVTLNEFLEEGEFIEGIQEISTQTPQLIKDEDFGGHPVEAVQKKPAKADVAKDKEKISLGKADYTLIDEFERMKVNAQQSMAKFKIEASRDSPDLLTRQRQASEQLKEELGIGKAAAEPKEEERIAYIPKESRQTLRAEVESRYAERKQKAVKQLREYKSRPMNSLDSIKREPFAKFFDKESEEVAESMQEQYRVADLLHHVKEESEREKTDKMADQTLAMKKKMEQIFLAMEEETNPYYEDPIPETKEEWKEFNEQRTKMLQNRLVQADFKDYPGSRKGPHPDDDPEHFAQWYVDNMPEAMKNMMGEPSPELFGLDPKTFEKEQAEETTDHMSTNDLLTSDISNLEMPLLNVHEKIMHSEKNLVVHSPLKPGELPPLPETFPLDYQFAQPFIERWAIFRLYRKMMDMPATLQRVADWIMANPDKCHPGPKLHSVYSYYYTLPKQARDSPIVKQIARGLEYHKHDVKPKDKEIMVNWAASFTQPLEPYVEEVCKEFIVSIKTKPTGKMADAFFKEIDQMEEGFIDTSKPHQILERIMNEWKYEGPDTYVKKPLDPYKPEEELEDLPLEYWDNEDGFWDEYIAEKQKRYGENIEIVHRPFFKH